MSKSKTAAAAPSIGHNKGPETAEAAIQAGLAERHRDLAKDVNAIIAKSGHQPKAIKTDDQAGGVGDFLKDTRTVLKSVEAARVDEKDEYLRAGKAVDGWFKALAKRIETAIAPVQQSLDAFVTAKEEKARREAEAEQERLQREAEKAAKQASRKRATDEDVERAADLAVQADMAGERAEASSADLVRTKSDSGTTVTVRKWWEGRVSDRNKLDLNALRPFMSDADLQKFVNAFVRAGHRELAGAVIEEKKESMVI